MTRTTQKTMASSPKARIVVKIPAVKLVAEPMDCYGIFARDKKRKAEREASYRAGYEAIAAATSEAFSMSIHPMVQHDAGVYVIVNRKPGR